MTVTIADLRNGTGLATSEITDAELTEALSMADAVASTWCSANGVPTSGVGYDVAVKKYAWANIYRVLDVKGIKPSSTSTASLSMSSDLAAAIGEFEKMAELALAQHRKANIPNQRDAYVKHLRAGRGFR